MKLEAKYDLKNICVTATLQGRILILFFSEGMEPSPVNLTPDPALACVKPFSCSDINFDIRPDSAETII